MINENIKKFSKIRFTDLSDYDSEKANDGGCYGFWTDYTKIDNDKWEVSHGTTADMDFCPCCGSFEDHYDYEKESYSCGDFETITTDELVNLINNFQETETEYIDFFD